MIRDSSLQILSILLLSMGLWLAADFYGEYKKNNLSEQAKMELIQKEEEENKALSALLRMNFSDVRAEDKPRWVVQSVISNDLARILIALVAIAGIGWFYLVKKVE